MPGDGYRAGRAPHSAGSLAGVQGLPQVNGDSVAREPWASGVAEDEVNGSARRTAPGLSKRSRPQLDRPNGDGARLGISVRTTRRRPPSSSNTPTTRPPRALSHRPLLSTSAFLPRRRCSASDFSSRSTRKVRRARERAVDSEAQVIPRASAYGRLTSTPLRSPLLRARSGPPHAAEGGDSR